MNDAHILWQETAEGMAYLPASDALWRNAPAPLAARYNILGVPLTVATNAPILASLACDLFGEWGAPDVRSTAGEKQLCVYLHDVAEQPHVITRPAVLTRVQGECLFLTIGSSLGLADRASGFATAFVTPTLLAEPLLAQVCFLETQAMFLVCRERPGTLHAAAIIYRGRCLLLTGSSGAGKSTLAYACLCAGFGLLAEDIVFATPQDSGVEVWGSPWRLHLLPDAVGLFPELADAPCVRQLNGETKLHVHVNTVRSGAAVPHAHVWGVCSLRRTSERVTRLLPADPAHVRKALTDFKGDPPLQRESMEAATDRLLAGRAAHLEVGTDLDAAVSTLRHWIETG